MKSVLIFAGVAFLASSVALAEMPAQKTNPKLASVRKIFVEPIDGNGGAMAREQLIALLTNSKRFEVVEESKLADAVLKGRAESQDTGEVVTVPTTKTQDGGGFFGGLASVTGRKGSATRIIKATLVIRLSLPTGEIVWAWDDTKNCSGKTKAQCAVEDLVKQAK